MLRIWSSELRKACEDLVLGRLQDTVEPAEHDERQGDAAVLGLRTSTPSSETRLSRHGSSSNR